MAKKEEVLKETTEQINSAKEEKIPDLGNVVQEETYNEVSKKVKVKLIKDLPRLFIVDGYYEGKRGDTLVVPISVAYILRGSDNTTDVFAV